MGLGIRTKITKFLYQRKFHKNKLRLDIKNKNILITGGNSGIGLALTKNLLALNNKVLELYSINVLYIYSIVLLLYPNILIL